MQMSTRLRFDMASLIKPSFIYIITIAVLTLGYNISHARPYDRPPYKYYYYGKDRKLIDNLDRELRQKVSYIEARLNKKLDKTVNIYLTLTLEDFNNLTHGRVPGWAGGIAIPGRNTVILKTPLFFGQGVPLEVLAAHELSHILIHEIIGDNYLPRWFEEGLCQVLSGESRHGSLGRLGRAAASNRLMGLPRADDVMNFSSGDADLAYSEARSAAARFISQFGWETVVQLLDRVGKGEEFDDAFLAAAGVEYEFWQVEWIEYARKRYSFAVLLDIDYMIWVFIVLLGSLAVLVVFIRRRIQFRRWLEEEEEEGEGDDFGGPIVPG